MFPNLDKPTDPTLTQYIEELTRRKVTDVCRVCESTYSAKRLEQAGIQCHDWAFDDGMNFGGFRLSVSRFFGTFDLFLDSDSNFSIPPFLRNSSTTPDHYRLVELDC